MGARRLCELRGCSADVPPDAPLELCLTHLLVAHDWATGTMGITDLLPAPCLACGSRLGVRYPSGWVCASCEWRVGDLPNGEPVEPRVDVVYYIRYRDQVKIGTSGNPRQRLATLPHDELLTFERGDRSVEQRRHAQFAGHRLGGTEWFGQHAALSVHIDELRAGVDDPWRRYHFWVSREIALRG